MAVNFGNTILEGDITPSVRVQNPVEDNSGAVLASALAPGAKAIGEVAGSIWKAGEDNKKASILVNYENELLDLADAVAQNGLDRNAALIRGRNIRRQYLANAPALQADFDKVWSSVVDANGLGNVIVQGTDADQANRELEKAAITNGYSNVEEYQKFLTRANEYKAVKQEHDLIVAGNGIVTDSLKARGLRSVMGLAESAYPAAQQTINDARRRIEANPAQREQIVAETINELTSSLSLIDGLGLGADTKFITDPVRDLVKAFGDWGNSTIEVGVLESQLKLTGLQYEAMLANDPVLAQFANNSKFLKSVGLNDTVIAGKLLTQDIITRLEQAVNPNTNLNILSNTEENLGFSRTISDAIGVVDDSNPEAVADAKKIVAGIVDGSWINERAAQDGALGWKPVVESLGSLELAEFVRKHGTDIPAQHRDKLVPVLREYYDKELTDTIAQYWKSAIVGTAMVGAPFGVQATPGQMREEPISNVAQPVWNGNAVEFVPKEGFENDANARTIINDLNSGPNSIGEPLNTLIRAHAFLSKTDPKRVWEENFANTIFGIGPDGQPLQTPSAQDVLDPVQEDGEGEVDALVTGAVNDLDNIQAVASYTGDTSNAALSAITSTFNLADFNIDEDAVRSSVLGYAPSNYNPVSIIPGDGGAFDVIGALAGTGGNEETELEHNHGPLDVKFGRGIDTRVNHRVVDTWAKVQQEFGSQLTIVSGFRDPSRNAKAGGAKLSQHMHGNAIDIETGHLSHAERLKLIEIASKAGFTGIGVYNNNLHFDLGGKRAWGPNYRNASVPSWARAAIDKHLGS